MAGQAPSPGAHSTAAGHAAPPACGAAVWVHTRCAAASQAEEQAANAADLLEEEEFWADYWDYVETFNEDPFDADEVLAEADDDSQQAAPERWVREFGSTKFPTCGSLD